MHAFCTLFDSNYLDKGIALYRSLSRNMEKFTLYILPMDDLCKDILLKMSLQNVVVIPQDQFEDDELRELRKERSRAEYCWTCTASLLDYILEKYDMGYCTYLDSDLYFFQSPELLLSEMYQNDSSVQIVEHRFGKGERAAKRILEAGKYCVQFNTFKNDENGRHVLKIWKDQCRKHCSMQPGELGDQKYLNNWATQYAGIHELQNHGGGVAPWNIGRYRLLDSKDQQIRIWGKDTRQSYPLVFYHFHNLEYLDENTVNLNIYKTNPGIDEALVKKIYYPYLKEIEEIKDYLRDNYGFRPIIRKHPGIVVVKGKRTPWIKKIRGKSLTGIFDSVENKITFKIGLKKDIFKLEKL